MKRSFSDFYRVFLTLLGVFLLLLSFPHSSPWDMSNLTRDVYHHSLVFSASLPFSTTRMFLLTPAIFLFIVSFVFFAVAAVPFKTLKRTWLSLRSHKRAFIGGFAAAEIFIITLMPSEPHFITTGPAAVLYLLTASFGLFFLLAGTAPLIRSALDRRSISELLDTSYEFLRRAILESPPPLFVGTLVLLELVMASVTSALVFENIPHVQDSIAQLFHARIFAEGVLTAPSPPHREFFDYVNVINDGRWYSQYPPGHTILLTLGVLLGAPWIINPLLGALTVGVVYYLGKELYGEVIGRLSALLALLSPFILFMSSEFMNHSSALFFASLFLLFLVKSLRTGKFLHGLIAGGAIGWVGCIRPYTAIAIAFPALLYAAVQFFKRPRELRNPVIGFGLISLAFVGILLGFNYLTNGHPLLFGYEKLWGPLTGIGFGKGPWGPPHTPMNGLRQTISNLNGINKHLFEWPVPSLLFIVLFFFTGTRNRWDVLLITTLASPSVFYFFYWFQDWCFGPRFLYEATAAAVVLSARGIERIPVLWRDVFGFETPHRRVRILTAALLVILFSIGFATNIPPHIKFYGNSYWAVSAEILDKVEKRGITEAVVFVRSNYGKGFVGNDPFMRNRVIYVKDLQDQNHLIMELYPDHDYYIAVGGTLTRVEPKEDPAN